jgi:hypothetical protein
VVQQIVHGLHVEALLDLGEGRVDDMQEHCHYQEAAPCVWDEMPPPGRQLLSSASS